MPYFGLLLFYDRVIALHDSKINVFQCPTTGFLPFYRTVLRVLATWDNCFNALFRAFFFSTRREMEDHMISVSLFQCPISGFLLFYVSQTLPVLPVSKVSMPYLGLSSFLRYVSASLEFTGFANPFLRVII